MFASGESFGEDYERNLKKAVIKLEEIWGHLFAFEEKDKKLRIVRTELLYVTDDEVDELSKNLIEVLGENQLFNLFGLEIDFSGCFELTDKALEDVAIALSNKALHIQHLTLNFQSIPKISDIGVEKLAVEIKESCHNLQELCMNFASGLEVSNKVTTEKKESLRKRFAHIPKLEIK